MNEPRVGRPQPDPLAKLERDVLDRNVPLADVLRTCVMLAGWMKAAQVREWAAAELKGYPGREVPDYRKVRAPIMQVIQSRYGTPTKRLFDVNSVPGAVREHFTGIVPLNQGVDELAALVTEHEAQQRQMELGHFAGEACGPVRVGLRWWSCGACRGGVWSPRLRLRCCWRAAGR